MTYFERPDPTGSEHMVGMSRIALLWIAALGTTSSACNVDQAASPPSIGGATTAAAGSVGQTMSGGAASMAVGGFLSAGQMQGGAAGAETVGGQPNVGGVSASGAGGTGGMPTATGLPAQCTFLMIGQSNMSGMAPVEAQDTEPLPGVFKISFNKEWLPGGEPFSINPYNEDSTAMLGVQSMGPSRAFAAELMKLLPNPETRTFYVVNAAVSGSAIESWMAKDSENYSFMLPYLQEGLKKAPLCGLVWHQGEANGGTDPETYASMLKGIHAHIAEDAQAKALPWVAGQVGTDGSSEDNVNQALVLIAASDESFGWASSSDTQLVDNVHYDAPSQRLLGQRYAQKFVEVLERQ